MAPPRSKTPSSLHRSSRPTNPGPEQYPEAEIGILDKEPGPSKSKTKTPSRRHHHRRRSQPIEAEAEAEPAGAAADTDGQEAEQQIRNLLGLAEATIPTAEDAPSPNEWAKFLAKADNVTPPSSKNILLELDFSLQCILATILGFLGSSMYEGAACMLVGAMKWGSGLKGRC